MLKRRAKDKMKGRLPEAEVNIVSLMDILTTLLFFIIMMASFNEFFALPASPLQMGKAAEGEQKPTFVLKVRLESENKLALYLGPVEGLTAITDKNGLKSWLRRRFSGNESRGYTRTVYHKNKETVQKNLQDILLVLKKHFPHESKAVLDVRGQVHYQVLTDTLSSVRSLGDTSEALTVINALGKEEKTRVLFPQVVISEWTGEV